MKAGKIISLAILTVVTLSALTACGGKEADDNKNSEQQIQSQSISENGEDTQDSAAATEFVYYVPNDNADGLDKVELHGNIDAEPQNPQYIIDKLIEEGVVAEGTKVNAFTELSPGTYQLDVSPEFYGLSWGASANALALDAIGNTFIENFGISKVKLTIDGENYSDGHMMYEDDDYLTFVELDENSTITVKDF